MIGRPSLSRLSWAVATAAACLLAAWITVDTLRAIVPRWSPLPWFDEWATVDLIGAWQAGDMSAAQVLFAQHNEHRVLVPRLVFFADDLFFHGGGSLSLIAIFTVQALHAALFTAVLGRANPPQSGRWALAAVVLALMFSLRQAENFSSGFQLAFVGVFAGATLSFVLFGRAMARERRAMPIALPLVASFAAVLLTSFTMANGLAAGFVLVALALAGRMRPRIVLACLAWAVLVTMIYLNGYEPPAQHGRAPQSLRQALDVLLYVATYLGGIMVERHIASAAALGMVGIGMMLAAAVRILRQERPDPAALAMFGVMLFAAAAAAVTASGRLEFGIGQALSSRYVTGSVAFWAAQLTYWWIAPPAWPTRSDSASHAAAAGALTRGGVAMVAMVLCYASASQQHGATPRLVAQSFAQNESADLLMLGLADAAVIGRTAWSAEGVARLLPVLKADQLSIFGTSEARGVGRPVTEQGTLLLPEACGGTIGDAAADPTLGRDGLRVSGTGWIGPARRLLRRILLADEAGRLMGFGSGAIPGAGRSEWRGFAVAPVGARLTAYGRIDDRHLCRIGETTVAGGLPGHAAAGP